MTGQQRLVSLDMDRAVVDALWRFSRIVMNPATDEYRMSRITKTAAELSCELEHGERRVREGAAS